MHELEWTVGRFFKKKKITKLVDMGAYKGKGGYFVVENVRWLVALFILKPDLAPQSSNHYH